MLIWYGMTHILLKTTAQTPILFLHPDVNPEVAILTVTS